MNVSFRCPVCQSENPHHVCREIQRERLEAAEAELTRLREGLERIATNRRLSGQRDPGDPVTWPTPAEFARELLGDPDA